MALKAGLWEKKNKRPLELYIHMEVKTFTEGRRHMTANEFIKAAS